jgi:HD superfamily phosphodiesterase
MNLTELIESAEQRFKLILEEFFISVYPEMYLTSHGIDHHRRVWNYAKKLMPLYRWKDDDLKSSVPSGLIIACYLHDIGMLTDPGVKHGKQSREFCRRFLTGSNLNENDYADVLETIENHDIKDYPGNAPVSDMLTLLSLADDLDALGYTGIFRYSEIYLARGTSLREIGHLIIANAGRRFDNFLKQFPGKSKLRSEQRKRYDILINFFREYNKQLDSGGYNLTSPKGYRGVIDLFLSAWETKMSMNDLFMKAGNYAGDPVIVSYFSGLKEELASHI